VNGRTATVGTYFGSYEIMEGFLPSTVGMENSPCMDSLLINNFVVP